MVKMSITAARVQRGLTQSDLADRLSISVPTLARLEREPDLTTFRRAKQIAEALDIEVKDIDFSQSDAFAEAS